MTAAFSVVTGLLLIVMSTLSASQTQADTPLQITLHPPDSLHHLLDKAQTAFPFHQTIPLAQGAFRAKPGDYTLSIAGKPTAAFIMPVRYWSDGSVRMLRVHAIWPANQGVKSAVPAVIQHVEQRQETVDSTAVEIVDERTIRFTPANQPDWQMRIRASAVPLLRDKRLEETTHPDYWDAEGQYHWAQSIDDVSDADELVELSPVIRSHTILEQTALYREHLIEGVGGASSPGSDLEWQLRIVEYTHTDLFELTMTWKVFWDPKQYALAEASVRLVSPEPVTQLTVPGLELAQPLENSTFSLYAYPNARYDVLHDDRLIHEGDGVDARADAWAMQVGGAWLGLAAPRMTRLGPNHLRVQNRTIELASWSHHQQAVLDLRRTPHPDEIGLVGIDYRDSAAGLAFSRRFTLAFSDERQEATALASMYADYGQYWFASRADYLASQALGPWREHVPDQYDLYLQGLRANIHFLLNSRHHWRWTGLINYGDVRTNFALEERSHRGYFPGRWAMHGRFGWRNGASEPYLGMLVAGLFLEDREILLAGLDYAFHVADIDLRQPRQFGAPLPRTGGFHRRNKDHWSGSIQVQYTPSGGLYLAQWLTGEQRLAQATDAIRGFMQQDGGVSGSLYAASAWINQYQQTHDEQALERAKRLFDRVVRVWEMRLADRVTDGPQLLYYDSFRRKLDSYPVLIEFFEATGDRQYLDHMLASILDHGPPTAYTHSLDAHVGPAYLLANGYSPQEIGQERMDVLHAELERFLPTNLPSYATDDYDALMTLTTEHLPPMGSNRYLASNAIGRRARNAFTVLSWFQNDEAHFNNRSDSHAK